MSDEEAASAAGHQSASTSASSTGTPAQIVQPPSSTQEALRGIPLPPPFLNDGRESFQLWARRYEVIQAARYKDSGVDLDTVLAAELPTRLPPELFIVWDNLPQETQVCYTETKRHLQNAFGHKDVIASFQTFPNAHHRLPNEAMEVYAADICRLVKEAFPDFEHNASEYMKMSRFIAGLDQELQVKCHERGVKTLTEAFEVASQAERARQAAKLMMPASSANVAIRDMGIVQSVNSVSETNIELRKTVQTLTTTVKDLSQDLAALKLKLEGRNDIHHYDRHMRTPRSPSPYGRSPERSTNARNSGYGRSPSRYSYSHHSSPERYPPQRARHHQEYTHRESDRYRQPYREPRYSDQASSPYEEHGGRKPSPSRPYYDSHRRSPSPYARHVSFQEQEDKGQARRPNDWDQQHPSGSGFKERGRFQQGNGH